MAMHACFGKYMDEQNCGKCIELDACLEEGQKNSDSAMNIKPPEPKKSPGRPKKSEAKEPKEDNE